MHSPLTHPVIREELVDDFPEDASLCGQYGRLEVETDVEHGRLRRQGRAAVLGQWERPDLAVDVVRTQPVHHLGDVVGRDRHTADGRRRCHVSRMGGDLMPMGGG